MGVAYETEEDPIDWDLVSGQLTDARYLRTKDDHYVVFELELEEKRPVTNYKRKLKTRARQALAELKREGQ